LVLDVADILTVFGIFADRIRNLAVFAFDIYMLGIQYNESSDGTDPIGP
jgi:hypothetical protein